MIIVFKSLNDQQRGGDGTEKTLPVRGKGSFEEMKRVNNHGAEFWSARDLLPLSSRMREKTTLATE